MSVWYNEIDPFAAQWLRGLIVRQQIAPGLVCERDIRSVVSTDLAGAAQARFFAGIGAWSYALRLAGWPDSVPVWTGSCPCQPFSNTGKKQGFDDSRHLWPVWRDLIAQCRPPTIFGEQVTSPLGRDWLSLVRAEMEALGYAFGAADLCAAGVGAPHIRQRLFWVAYCDSTRLERPPRKRRDDGQEQPSTERSGGEFSGLGHADSHAAWGNTRTGTSQKACSASAREVARRHRDVPQPSSRVVRVANDNSERREGIGLQLWQRRQEQSLSEVTRSGAHVEAWRVVEWVYCRDRKLRPIEPGTLPLVDGTSPDVGRLRGYGNAIVAPLAALFIRAAMDVIFE